MQTPATQGHPVGAVKTPKRYPRAPRIIAEVTAEMIASAKVRDSSHCMTAAAVAAAFPGAQRIAVDLQTIRFSDPARRLRYVFLTPRLVQQAIVLWDQGRDIEPFSFQLIGAHVLPMHEPTKMVTGIATTTEAGGGQQPVAVAVRKRSLEKANQARQGLRLTKNKTVERVGGKAPPLDVPFSRRRSFGLRALVR